MEGRAGGGREVCDPRPGEEEVSQPDSCRRGVAGHRWGRARDRSGRGGVLEAVQPTPPPPIKETPRALTNPGSVRVPLTPVLTGAAGGGDSPRGRCLRSPTSHSSATAMALGRG